MSSHRESRSGGRDPREDENHTKRDLDPRNDSGEFVFHLFKRAGQPAMA
jgi:hypothetical protein